MADQSYLVKIVRIMNHKCSQADIACYSDIRSHAEQRTGTKQRVQTNRWLTCKQSIGQSFILIPSICININNQNDNYRHRTENGGCLNHS